MTTIRRNLALKEMEVKETPDGSPVVFSIRFIKVNGESVFIPRAVACGLRANMSKNRMRAVSPVNSHNERSGHVYPVRIDNIIEHNGRKVVM